jgi:hypothetical protein
MYKLHRMTKYAIFPILIAAFLTSTAVIIQIRLTMLLQPFQIGTLQQQGTGDAQLTQLTQLTT